MDYRTEFYRSRSRVVFISQLKMLIVEIGSSLVAKS